jgi:hypothetical protein
MLRNVTVIISKHIHHIHTDSGDKMAKTKTDNPNKNGSVVEKIAPYEEIFHLKIACRGRNM